MSEETSTAAKESKTAFVMEWVRDIAIAAAIAFLITLVIKPTVVKESSMEPNFYENDYLFLNKLAYKFGGQPKKGDVIVFRSNEVDPNSGKRKLFIKRVIGVPGDRIDIIHNHLYINNKRDDESYTLDQMTGLDDEDMRDIRVQEGTYFCLGDNRNGSKDSRDPTVGPVDKDVIVGKAFFRLLPFNRAGPIKSVYK